MIASMVGAQPFLGRKRVHAIFPWLFSGFHSQRFQMPILELHNFSNINIKEFQKSIFWSFHNFSNINIKETVKIVIESI